MPAAFKCAEAQCSQSEVKGLLIQLLGGKQESTALPDFAHHVAHLQLLGLLLLFSVVQAVDSLMCLLHLCGMLPAACVTSLMKSLLFVYHFDFDWFEDTIWQVPAKLIMSYNWVEEANISQLYALSENKM